MKFLDPSQATDTAQQPVKNGTLQFLQDSHKENLANLIRGIIGPHFNPNGAYRLWGGALTGLTSIFPPLSCVVEPGAYFYNNEVFYSNGGPCFINTGEAFLLVMRTAQYSPAAPLQADPVTFTDGHVYNVHNIRTAEVIGGPLGGSGVAGYIADFFSVTSINILIETPNIYGYGLAAVTGNYPNFNINVPALNLTTTGLITHSGTWPNITLDVPVPPVLRNPVLCAGTTILTAGNVTQAGDVAGGNGGYVRVDFVNATPPLNGNTITDYYVMGSLYSIRANNNYDDPTVIWSVEEQDENGFSIWIRETASVVQEINLNWICFVK